MDNNVPVSVMVGIGVRNTTVVVAVDISIHSVLHWGTSASIAIGSGGPLIVWFGDTQVDLSSFHSMTFVGTTVLVSNPVTIDVRVRRQQR